MDTRNTIADSSQFQSGTLDFGRYAAIGDSFSEGMGDERADGYMVGWADRVAIGLAAHRGEAIDYANFSIRGRLLEPIVHGQLDAALALEPKPTLLTLNGGGNDMLRRNYDQSRVLALTAEALQRCRQAGVRVVLLSGADPTEHLPFGRYVRPRAENVTNALAELAAEHGVAFVDCFHDAEVRKRHYWSDDKMHLNAIGHAHVASLVLHALIGTPVAAPAPVPPPTRSSLAATVHYWRIQVIPWFKRRLTGRSSGDGRVEKHPHWTRIAPDHA